MPESDSERVERLRILKELRASLRERSDSKGLLDLLRQKAEIDREIQEKFFRLQTFVDMDVQGSTRMKEGEDSQTVFSAFAAYHELVKTIVETNSGEIAATAGDGIVAAFDSPNAACRAATAIVDRLDKFNDTENKLKNPILLRVGVNSGKVLIDPDNELGQVFDETLDEAKQLQKECPPGDVLITENTYKLLDDRGAFESLRFWEGGHINIYRYRKASKKDALLNVPPSFLENLPPLRLTPLIDPVAGTSVRNLSAGMRVWVKRTDTVYVESVVQSAQAIGEGHYLVVVYMAGGTRGWSSVQNMLKICSADDRAQSLAETARGVKVRLQRLGSEDVPSFRSTARLKWVLIGVGIVAGILIVTYLFRM